MQSVCDMCKKQDHLFPCSGCGLFRYCSPRCQTEHLKIHGEECKLEIKRISEGQIPTKDVYETYRSFCDNKKVILFLAGFAYYCHIKYSQNVPQCIINLKLNEKLVDGKPVKMDAYIAGLYTYSRPEMQESIIKSKKPGYVYMLYGYKVKHNKLPEQKEKGMTLYSYKVFTMIEETAKKMYHIYSSIFDHTESIYLEMYNEATSVPKGVKVGDILLSCIIDEVRKIYIL